VQDDSLLTVFVFRYPENRTLIAQVYIKKSAKLCVLLFLLRQIASRFTHESRYVLMTQFHKRQSSFVIRIWWEQAGSPGTHRSVWRGWVQHPSSNEETYVQDLNELLRFMERWTGPLTLPDDPVSHTR